MSKEAIHSFAEISKGFDITEKLKLVLFTADVKPNTYVNLKINPEDLGEKYRFEQLLKENKIPFLASRKPLTAVSEYVPLPVQNLPPLFPSATPGR